jgi:putative membrane protein
MNNGNGHGNGHWQMHDHAGAGFGWLMLLLMLVLTIAVVVAVVAFVRGASTPATGVPVAHGDVHADRAADARAILRERFARGDIDEQEFRARMRALDDTVT